MRSLASGLRGSTCGWSCCLSFLLQVPLEGAECGLPEPSDFFELPDQLLDGLATPRGQLIDPLAPLLPCPYEAHLGEQTRMFADRGTTDSKALGERACPARIGGEAAQQLAPSGIGERDEARLHLHSKI